VTANIHSLRDAIDAAMALAQQSYAIADAMMDQRDEQ
jgi:hypothetical protein